jgi:hypothetical protein
MELIAGNVEAFHLGFADLDALLIAARIECALDFQTGLRQAQHFRMGAGDQAQRRRHDEAASRQQCEAADECRRMATMLRKLME